VKKPTAWAAEPKFGKKNSTTATTNGDFDLFFDDDFSLLDGLVGCADDDDKKAKFEEKMKKMMILTSS
jgi:hypothetical protein